MGADIVMESLRSMTSGRNGLYAEPSDVVVVRPVRTVHELANLFLWTPSWRRESAHRACFWF